MNKKNINKIIWAPWRSEYLSSFNKRKNKNKCFLCDRKDTNNQEDEFMVIKRGVYSFVMLNAWPYNPYHLLVSPYQHIDDIISLDKKIICEIMDFTVFFKKIINDIASPTGFNIGCNIGSEAGINEHFHMHLVPRWNGDTNFMSVFSDVRILSQSLKESADVLRAKI